MALADRTLSQRRLRRAGTVAGLAAVALCSAPLSAQTRPDTIEVGVEDAAAPWSQADGTGFANDVARAAFAASGIVIRQRVLPYARCKSLVVSGSLVACV